MSLADASFWSALRAMSIALAAAPLCSLLARFLRASTSGEPTNASGQQPTCSVCPLKRWAWAFLLIPFLTPDLIVGYAYGNFSGLPLVHYPLLNELLYALLLAMKLVPVGTVVMYFSPPPPVTPEALYCRRLLFGAVQKPGFFKKPGFFSSRSFRPKLVFAWLGDVIRGPVRHVFPAAALMFLLAFQDFDLGSLLGVTAGRSGSPVCWTRRLFDGQQGVFDQLAPLRWSLWPLGVELGVLLPLLFLAAKSGRLFAADAAPARRGRPAGRALCWLYLAVSVLAVSVLPFVFVIRESTGGLAAYLGNRQQLAGLGNEILAGLVFACVSAILAYLLAAVALRHAAGIRAAQRSGFFDVLTKVPFEPDSQSPVLRVSGALGRQVAGAIAVLLLTPGLAGSLIVGLTMLFLFQTDPLYRLYDTPLPLAIALTLFLAPRAFLLQLLLRAARPREPVRLAELLRRSELRSQNKHAGLLLWKLKGQSHYWATALLGFWAYWDLTSTSLLAPSLMVPAPTRLYNQMHYGHNAILSTMTLLAIAAPLVVVFVGVWIVRPIVSRFAWRTGL